ncbi:MFS transporter [Streptomyces sp. NPDC020965]|uniref:MFS transporter n=1 Tax=Streptomyces sp. NPDC020965 TaxID=3365105 RepID=UPI0037A12AE0
MLLWGGQSLSLFGAEVTIIALPLIAVHTMDSSTFEVALLTTFTTLPWLLFSLPAGVVVDRYPKRSIMLWTDIARGAVLCSVPLAVAAEKLSIFYLYGVALLCGTLAVFFHNAYLSFPATLLRKDQLVDANAKTSMASTAAMVAGPSLSGFLIGGLGAAGAIALDGVAYLVSAASLLFIRHREPRKPRRLDEAKPTFLRDIMAGLRLLIADPVLRPITLSNVLGNFLFAAFTSIWLLYAVRDLGWSVTGLGLVMGLSSIGSVVGSLAAKPLINKYGLESVIIFGQVLLAPGYFIAALGPSGTTGQIFITFGLFSGMLSLLVYNIGQHSYRMIHCPQGMIGRINASASWLQWGVRPFAALSAGGIASWVGIKPTLLACACLFPLCLLILWRSPLREQAKGDKSSFA